MPKHEAVRAELNQLHAEYAKRFHELYAEVREARQQWRDLLEDIRSRGPYGVEY